MQEYIADIPAMDKVQLAGLAKHPTLRSSEPVSWGNLFYTGIIQTQLPIYSYNPFMVYGGNQGNYVSHKKSHHFLAW